MKTRRIATAEAASGAATQMDQLSGTSRVTAGIDLFDSWGLTGFPGCRSGQSTQDERESR